MESKIVPGARRHPVPRSRSARKAAVAAAGLAALFAIAVLSAGCKRSMPAQRAARATDAAGRGLGWRSPAGQPQAEEVRSEAAQPYGSLETWGRKLVLTAAISLEVKDVRAAYDRIQLLAAREGALVTGATLKASSDAEEDAGSDGQASLTLRMPQSRFQALRQRLLGLAGDLGGKVLSDEVSSEDVTEEYVDLQARLRHWRSQEVQLLEIMRQAHKIGDILAVRDQVSQVQQEIERVTGRLRFLENRVDLSTITVELEQKGKAPVEPTILANFKSAGKAIGAAFKTALVNVVYVAGMICVGVTYLLPFAALGALIWVAIRALRRKASPRAPAT